MIGVEPTDSPLMQSFKTRSARRAPPAAGRAAASVFADLAKRTKFVDPALAEHWPTIAGREIAALCRPGRIAGTRAGRTLEVYVPSGAAAAQLQMLSDDLKTRVNRYLGPGAVAKITIKQRAASHTPNPAAGPKPDGSSLDKALSSFRAAIRTRDGNKGGDG